MTAPGILSIFNNVAPGREGDFEEWFQHEHLAERMAVPGFLLGRRYEGLTGDRRFFNFYLTETPDVLRSGAYLSRVNAPTPMSKMIMSEVFRDMVRNVSERAFFTGDARGAHAITARFGELPALAALQEFIVEQSGDKAFACGEVWLAKNFGLSNSTEESLRGGDKHFAACMLIETLREGDAARIFEILKQQFPAASVGTFRLLCEARPKAGG